MAQIDWGGRGGAESKRLILRSRCGRTNCIKTIIFYVGIMWEISGKSWDADINNVALKGRLCLDRDGGFAWQTCCALPFLFFDDWRTVQSDFILRPSDSM